MTPPPQLPLDLLYHSAGWSDVKVLPVCQSVCNVTGWQLHAHIKGGKFWTIYKASDCSAHINRNLINNVNQLDGADERIVCALIESSGGIHKCGLRFSSYGRQAGAIVITNTRQHSSFNSRRTEELSKFNSFAVPPSALLSLETVAAKPPHQVWVLYVGRQENLKSTFC